MLSADQLRAALVAAGIPNEACRIFGEDRECTMPSWVSGEFAAAFEKFLFSSGVSSRDGQFECHQFAKLATSMADLCWFKTGRSEAGLALGMFGYLASGGHMICVGVHAAAKGGFYVAFYEPQNMGNGFMRPVVLSEEEIRSCTSCFFI